MTARLPPPKNSSAIQTAAPPEVTVYQPRRARGFLGNLLAILLQPGTFFRTFPTNTQWVIVALVALVLAGVLAVRMPTGTDPNTAAPVMSDSGNYDPSMGGGGVIMSDGGMGGVSVAPPGGFDAGPTDTGTVTGPSSDEVRSTTTTALLGAGTFIILWILQAVLLCLVPLLRGRPADLGRNLQVAVWASIPIVIMIGGRLIYIASGGVPGAMGLSALIDHWEGFTDFSPFVQNVLFSLLSSMTLFWLWNVVLVYLGGRFALNGRSWAATLVTCMWIIVAVVLPVITGAAIAPTVQAATDAANNPEIVEPSGDANQGFTLNGVESFQTTPDPNSTAEATAEVDFSLTTEQPAADAPAGP